MTLSVIGVGVLGLPQAFARLGWAVSVVVLVVVTLIATYSSLILAWLRGTVSSITTYPSLAAYASRGGGELSFPLLRKLKTGEEMERERERERERETERERERERVRERERGRGREGCVCVFVYVGI